MRCLKRFACPLQAGGMVLAIKMSRDLQTDLNFGGADSTQDSAIVVARFAGPVPSETSKRDDTRGDNRREAQAGKKAAIIRKDGRVMSETKHHRFMIGEPEVEASKECGAGGLRAQVVVMYPTGNKMPTCARILEIAGIGKGIDAAWVVPGGGSSAAAAPRWKDREAPRCLNVEASFRKSSSRDVYGKTRGPPMKM